jgi:hypothetical protein
VELEVSTIGPRKVSGLDSVTCLQWEHVCERARNIYLKKNFKKYLLAFKTD